MRIITVIGSVNIDLVAVAPRLPRPGETVLGNEYRVVCGGKGANQAVAAARLGANVRFVGCVGHDEYGRMARENLRRHRVDVRGLRRVRGHTGVALIVVDSRGRNLIAVAPNANARVVIPRRRLDIAVLQLETPWRLPRAKTVILNPAPANLAALRAAARDRRRPLDGVALIVPNEIEAEQLTGQREPVRAARELVKMGAGRAIITLGERGVYVGGERGAAGRHERPFRVKVVDTVGAGDAFVGALAAAIAENRPDAVRFAQAAAALKCTRPGAQNLPTRCEVERLLVVGERGPEVRR